MNDNQTTTTFTTTRRRSPLRRERGRELSMKARRGPLLRGTLLSIWAHPDDETYLAAGFMAAAAEAGQRVVCISATAGELGSADPAWPPARLGPTRRWEAAAAMAILGVDEHRFLDLPDGGLAELDPEIGVRLVTRLLDELQPTTIVTFGPDGKTFHPDHIAMSCWVTEAWRRAGRVARLLQVATTADQLDRFGDVEGVYMTDERPVAVAADQLSEHLVLSGPELDRKVAALAAMATQTSGLIGALGPTAYAAAVAEEAFVAVHC
jgi:LmbE family N-acetylglucosaminyl deacetylase